MAWPRTGIIILPNNQETNADACLKTAPATPCTDSNSGNSVIDNALVGSILFSNMDVKYFKINLESTVTNMYGEATEKWYYPGADVKCLIDRGVTTNGDDDFGVTVNQTITVSIPKGLLIQYNFLPEVGDIVMDRERYYEVNSIDSIFATLPGTGASNGQQGTTGQITMYVLSCYLTRITKLNLIEYYQ
jgi:hypothetical protein